jgi:hypothetical protein
LIEQTDISMPRADLEYILDALENALNLSLTHDLQDRIRSLSPKLTKSKLSKMIEASVTRLETELREEVVEDESEQNG